MHCLHFGFYIVSPVCTHMWFDTQLFNIQAFHYRLPLKVTLNVECLFEGFYQVICMYPRSLSSLADRLDSDCTPGVVLPPRHVPSLNNVAPYFLVWFSNM